MKRIITVVQIALFLQTTAVLAGNGNTLHNSANRYSDVIQDFSTISKCFHDDNMESNIIDSGFLKIAIRTPYPGYSFNVLKRPLYAQNSIPSNTIIKLSKA